VIIGTAGHIDHGKSALVRALTGQTMDRLQEERRRGITIDLNFAPLVFEGMPPVGVVDVPGHEDFVRTMVAGASGMDLVLLVIDAGEGPMPQTLEHLAIVEQLGVSNGIPVLTKCDLVTDDWLDLVEAELAERLAESTVAFGPVARVSAVTGAGIEALHERLHDAARAAAPRRTGDSFRMPVDRAFSLAGVGTVLTGTTWSGDLRVGDQVRLLPSGLEGRVRSLSSHNHDVELLAGGMRSAVGVAGLERGTVKRGELLVRADEEWEVTEALDVELSLLPTAPRALAPRTRLRVHLGTAELLARVYPRSTIEPGGSGLARLALESPVVARAGDRLVLRSYSPVTTIGGGVVLDPAPPRRSRWPEALAEEAAGARLLALLGRRTEGLTDDSLPQYTGLTPGEATRLAEKTVGIRRIGDRWVESSRVRAAEAQAVAHLEGWHQAHPAEAGLSLSTLRQVIRAPEWVTAAALQSLEKRGELVVADGLTRLPGFQPSVAGGSSLLDRIVESLEAAGLTPPTVAELEATLKAAEVEAALRLLARAGGVERVSPDWYFARSALDRFSQAVREVAAGQGEVTPGALRERLGLTRKYLIPLLEWSDRQGLTRREGERRVLVERGGEQ
jgi:selenocysteine-specific elongation factor